MKTPNEKLAREILLTVIEDYPSASRSFLIDSTIARAWNAREVHLTEIEVCAALDAYANRKSALSIFASNCVEALKGFIGSHPEQRFEN